MPCMCGDTECPSCGTAQGTYSGNRNPEKITLSGRTFTKAVAPCSCCGMAPEQAQENDPDWDTYRAGLCDDDGVYFSYLCHHADAGGCLDDIAAEVQGGNEHQQKADVLRGVLGDDEDGIWSEMTD